MPLNDTELQEALFPEKTLGDVTKNYHLAFSKPAPAWRIAIIAFVVLAGCSILLDANDYSFDKTLQYSEQIVGFTVVLISTFFGISIAGFSIFASALRGPTLAALVERQEPNGKAPYLRHLFGIFVFTLITFFWMIAFAFVYHLAFSEGSPLLEQHSPLSINASVQLIVLLIFMSAYLSATIYALCILRSFVWNLYQVLLIVSAMSYREWRDKP
jgi:hypothetical protein